MGKSARARRIADASRSNAVAQAVFGGARTMVPSGLYLGSSEDVSAISGNSTRFVDQTTTVHLNGWSQLRAESDEIRWRSGSIRWPRSRRGGGSFADQGTTVASSVAKGS